MKGRLYANWLVVITLFLFFSSLGVFLIYIQDNLVNRQCAYGDDLGNNCVCNSDGEKICDTQIVQTTNVSEFTSKDLIYTFDFLNLTDSNNPPTEKIKFIDISRVDESLKVIIEIDSMCNQDNIVSPQIGFYKLDNQNLLLTVVSNLTDPSFNLPCRSENIFVVDGFKLDVEETFKVQFQDEFESVYQADTCIYNGYIRNDGDIYKSQNGEQICKCDAGTTVCENE